MKDCCCEDCVSACNNDPGRLIPEDLYRISDFLKITVKELIKEFIVFKMYEFKNHKIYIAAPAKLKGKRLLAVPGTIVQDYYEDENGRCIFLENNLCKIHKVKPFECSAYMGCQDSFLGKKYNANFVDSYFSAKWRTFPINKFL